MSSDWLSALKAPRAVWPQRHKNHSLHPFHSLNNLQWVNSYWSLLWIPWVREEGLVAWVGEGKAVSERREGALSVCWSPDGFLALFQSHTVSWTLRVRTVSSMSATSPGISIGLTECFSNMTQPMSSFDSKPAVRKSSSPLQTSVKKMPRVALEPRLISRCRRGWHGLSLYQAHGTPTHSTSVRQPRISDC